jgi:hypothetical protein
VAVSLQNGDVVECERIMGTVADISVRMIRVRNPSGELVVLPNACLFKKPAQLFPTVFRGSSIDIDVARWSGDPGGRRSRQSSGSLTTPESTFPPRIAP